MEICNQDVVPQFKVKVFMHFCGANIFDRIKIIILMEECCDLTVFLIDFVTMLLTGITGILMLPICIRADYLNNLISIGSCQLEMSIAE